MSRAAPYKPHTTFRQDVAEKILKAMKAGNYFETACAFAGVNPATGREWLVKGARGKTVDLARFARDVEEAEANVEVRCIGNIANAANGKQDKEGVQLIAPDWRANAWIVERRFSNRWGRHDTLRLSPDQANALSDEELDREMKRRGLPTS